MSTAEHLTKALRTALKNWPVLVINLVVALANCAAVVVFVLLPVAGLLLIAGISPMLLTNIHSHQALLRQIPWVAAASVVFMLFYLTVAVCIGLFVLAGTVGVVVHSTENPDEAFSLGRFISEGRRLFFPFLNYTALTGGLCLLVVLCLVVAGFFIKNLTQYLKAYSAALSYFVGIFSTVVGAVVLVSLLIWLLSVTFYGLIEIAVNNEGTMEAMRRTINFTTKKGGAVGFFILTGILYIVINIVVTGLGLSFKLTPFGFFLSIPFQFVSYLAGAAVGLWFISALVSYYLGCRG